MKHPFNRDDAQEIAIQALAFIVADPLLMERFLALSGIGGHDIRAAAAQPEFFSGILAFLLGNEPDLLAFCSAQHVSPEIIAQAFALLPGGHPIVHS